MSSRREATAAPGAAAPRSRPCRDGAGRTLFLRAATSSAWASSPTDIWAVGRDGATLPLGRHLVQGADGGALRPAKGVGVERRGGLLSLPEPGTNIAVLRHDGGSWAESRATTPSALQRRGDRWRCLASEAPRHQHRARSRCVSPAADRPGTISARPGTAAGPHACSRFAEPGRMMSGPRAAITPRALAGVVGVGELRDVWSRVVQLPDRPHRRGTGTVMILWLVGQDGTSLSFSRGCSTAAGAMSSRSPLRVESRRRGHELRGLGDGPDLARDGSAPSRHRAVRADDPPRQRPVQRARPMATTR